MAGKIWKYDTYNIRKFKPQDIDCFVDIGACQGCTSSMARILMPFARIIALEPVKITYDVCKDYVKALSIETYNIALGNGNSMCFIKKRMKGLHRFVSDTEKQWWVDSYTTPSKTLSQIFYNYKIFYKNYVLKIDCEGGERFLLNKESINIIRGSVQTMLELHLPFGGTGDQWNDTFKQLNDTHEMRLGRWIDKKGPNMEYVYNKEIVLPTSGGRFEIILVNRKWIKDYGI